MKKMKTYNIIKVWRPPLEKRSSSCSYLLPSWIYIDTIDQIEARNRQHAYELLQERIPRLRPWTDILVPEDFFSSHIGYMVVLQGRPLKSYYIYHPNEDDRWRKELLRHRKRCITEIMQAMKEALNED